MRYEYIVAKSNILFYYYYNIKNWCFTGSPGLEVRILNKAHILYITMRDGNSKYYLLIKFVLKERNTKALSFPITQKYVFFILHGAVGKILKAHIFYNWQLYSKLYVNWTRNEYFAIFRCTATSILNNFF